MDSVSSRKRCHGEREDRDLKKLCSEHNGSDEDSSPPSDTESAAIVDINTLPQSLLLNILSHLPMVDLLRLVSRVCKYWKSMSNDPCLWRHLKLAGQLKLTDQILERLTKISQKVHTIDLSDCRQITTPGLANVLEFAPALQVIKLVRCQALRDEAFSALANHCHNLQEAYFDNCYALSDTSLEAIGTGCHKLRVLSMNHCNMISDKGVCALAKGCPLLIDLQTDDCKKLTDLCLQPVTQFLPKLQVLNLSAGRFTRTGILGLRSLKDLQVIDLAHNSEVNNHVLTVISESCKKLDTINVNLCTLITDDAVEFVAKNSKQLTQLYVVACKISDKSLQALGRHSKNLKRLDVGWCDAVTEEGARFLSGACSSLEYLGLMRCDKISVEESLRLESDYHSIKFSTMFLDCRRLLVSARDHGHLPPDIPLPLSQDLLFKTF